MAMSNDPLNFFVLEAGECLEHLDAVLAGAGANGPDAVKAKPSVAVQRFSQPSAPRETKSLTVQP